MSNGRGHVQWRSWSAAMIVVQLMSPAASAAAGRSGPARVLSESVMDRITAGMVGSLDAFFAGGSGIGSATIFMPLTGTANPLAAAPLVNLSQTANGSTNARANAQVRGNTGTSVGAAGNGGAGVQAAVSAGASGPGSRAQFSILVFGVANDRADLVFGTITASACCTQAQAAIDVVAAGAGPFTSQLQSSPAAALTDEAQRRVDIALVSSRLPILDPAQVAAFSAIRLLPR